MVMVQKISESTIIEHTLQHILPSLLAEAIREHKLRPAIYPKFELIKANPNEDWEVRAVTAEIPEAKLGDYKDKITSQAKSNAIWTPGKGDEKKEVTPQDKEQLVVKTLIETVDITIPAILIEEETNARLSQLLEKIERLGLNLDSYLASVGKDVNKLREEYEAQSRETLKLDIVLNQIAQEEKISIPESDVTAAIQASAGDPSLAERLNTPEQRRVVESILRKRAALEKLTSLI
jgi:FKBP-type peptidyl-prolyl cis-trans isomerase (trigger factor)